MPELVPDIGSVHTVRASNRLRVTFETNLLAAANAATIDSLDLNPFVVLPSGALALDAVLVTRSPTTLPMRRRRSRAGTGLVFFLCQLLLFSPWAGKLPAVDVLLPEVDRQTDRVAQAMILVGNAG